jgi:hypothetical protein
MEIAVCSDLSIAKHVEKLEMVCRFECQQMSEINVSW